MSNINPFDTIVTQMNQAKANYDNEMQALQQRLAAVRQQTSAMYQNPLFPTPAAGTPIPQPQPQVQAQPQQPVENTAPASIQQLSILGEIKTSLEKILERLPELKEDKKNAEKPEEAINPNLNLKPKDNGSTGK